MTGRRRFRLGEATNDLHAAALAWARDPSQRLLGVLMFTARRWARELERMRALNAGART